MSKYDFLRRLLGPSGAARTDDEMDETLGAPDEPEPSYSAALETPPPYEEMPRGIDGQGHRGPAMDAFLRANRRVAERPMLDEGDVPSEEELATLDPSLEAARREAALKGVSIPDRRRR